MLLFLLLLLQPLIGFACLKLLDSRQWLIAMPATALVFLLVCTFLYQAVLGMFVSIWVFVSFFLPWFLVLWFQDQPFPKLNLQEMWYQPFPLLEKKEERVSELWGGADMADTVAPPPANERKLRLKRKS